MLIVKHIQKALRHQMRQRRAFLLLPFTICLFISCATSRPTLPKLPPITSAAELIQLTVSRYDSLHSQIVKASVDLTIDGVRERRAGARIWHKSPSDLRLVISGFGVTALQARTQNDTMRVYLPGENNLLIGQPENVLYTLTGVDLSFYVVDRAILGLPNLSPLDTSRVIRFEPSAEKILIELRHPGYLRRLWFGAPTGLLHEERIYDNDGQLISLRRLSDYHNENGFALPRQIEIRQGQDIILITVKSREINPTLTDKDFHFAIPRDATRHEID